LTEKEGFKGDKNFIFDAALFGIDTFPLRSVAGGKRINGGVAT
jgi:hypothetical protein